MLRISSSLFTYFGTGLPSYRVKYCCPSNVMVLQHLYNSKPQPVLQILFVYGLISDKLAEIAVFLATTLGASSWEPDVKTA